MIRGKFILVLGGARSGKSTFAEQLVADKQVTYIATAVETDGEMKERIATHNRYRPSDWTTIESPYDADKVLTRCSARKSTILLDCLTVFISNLMFKEIKSEDIIDRIEVMGVNARNSDANVVIVSNEVGLGIVPSYKSGRDFRDIAGKCNQVLSRYADHVFFSISGLQIDIKELAIDPKEGGIL